MVKQDLNGQVVLITGAARGIGAGLARALAGRGASVALVGLEPEELAEQARACGPDAGWWTADITSQEQISRATQAVRDRYGRIDVVVANAGVATGGTLRLADAAAYDRVVEINLIGSIRTARAVLPHLIETRGYYFQVASAAALVPAAVMGSYCASKSGVEAFAHVLKAEAKVHGVDVGIGYPLWIDTDLVRGADAIPSFKAARGSMPWPMNKTYPLDDAVQALAEAVVRRRSRVMFPGWLWGVFLNRGVAAIVAPRLGRRFARIAERTAAQNPGETYGLTGAGGAAATAAAASPDPAPHQGGSTPRS
jgi:NAD(P)-dependent dehydrogenase (short-subunit alcohol dehydrogenase family)